MPRHTRSPAASPAAWYARWYSGWYAETPARRSRQLISDGAALLGLLLCLWAGTTVHDLTTGLAEPGRSLESAGADLAARMDDAGAAADSVPVAGDALAAPFDGAGEASRAIEGAGVQQQAAVANLANTLGWVMGGLPALLVTAGWLPWRIRFRRQSGQAVRLREADGGLDVLALRALARQPLGALVGAGPGIVDGWRANDPAAISALADLELRRLGLRTGATRSVP